MPFLLATFLHDNCRVTWHRRLLLTLSDPLLALVALLLHTSQQLNSAHRIPLEQALARAWLRTSVAAGGGLIPAERTNGIRLVLHR